MYSKIKCYAFLMVLIFNFNINLVINARREKVRSVHQLCILIYLLVKFSASRLTNYYTSFGVPVYCC